MTADAEPAAIAQANYKIGQDNIRPFGLDIHNPVFIVSGVLTVAFVVLTLLFLDVARAQFDVLKQLITTRFDWLFMISANVFLLLCLALVFSRLGSIRIGGEDAEPDHGYLGWLAMLFSAGVGIGLMFFGVLEPVNHTLNPPLGIAAGDVEAARSIGMSATILHWGLHAWAIYAVVGLSLAFFCYNRGLPLTMRSAFYPLFGRAAWGWLGHTVDTLAVLASLFGLATSLGIGANQIAGGLDYLFQISPGGTTKVVLIVIITAVALASVVAGLDKGVKRLSAANMIVAALLLLFVLFAGPTAEIGKTIAIGTVDYLRHLPALSSWVGREDTGFYHGWTIFYWAWWVAWSPFVGMFIARVSRGRTVREFIVFVLILPTIAGIIWMGAFGGTALDQIFSDGYQGVKDVVVNYAPELALFKMLEALPFTVVTSVVGLVLIVVFFVTSSDSGSLVIDTITAGGKIDAPVQQRVFWCILEGLIAIALLLGGGLEALQALAIATGLPFAIVLLVMCVSLVKGLWQERAGA